MSIAKLYRTKNIRAGLVLVLVKKNKQLAAYNCTGQSDIQKVHHFRSFQVLKKFLK